MNQEKINKQIFEKLENYEKRLVALEISPSRKQNISVSTEDTTTNSNEELVLSIKNKILDCEENDSIESKILDKSDMEGRILLCFYISYIYFENNWLTTGDVQKITADLGIKLTAGNISNKITGKLKKYLESGTVRKKGQPTPYRFNRNGLKRVKEILGK